MDPSHLLSTSAAPAALVSACGLLTLALYNRLGSILARIRAFHQQKIELLVSLPKHQAAELHMLLDMLDSQIGDITNKAAAIQKGLYCMLGAIGAFLLSALFASFIAVHEAAVVVAFGLGILGLCLFIGGIAWAIRELTLSLTPLAEETAFLNVLTYHHLEQAQSGQRLKVAESA